MYSPSIFLHKKAVHPLRILYDITLFLFLFVVNFGTAPPAVIYNSGIIIFIAMSFLMVVLRKKIFFNKYIIWWSIVCAFSIINTIYSFNTNVTFSFTISTFFRLIISFSLVQYMITIDNFEKILNYLKIIGIILVTYALIAERSTFLTLGLGNSVGSIMVFSYPAIFITIIFLYDLFTKPNFINLLGTIYMYLALFLNRGKKSIFIPLIFLFILLMIRSRKNILKLIRNFLLISVLLIFILYLSFEVPFLYDLFGSRLESFINFSLLGTGLDESTLLRSNMIEYGITMFKEQPILGYGLDTYEILSPFGVYSHNNYIETLFSGGLVFLIIYYSFHLYLIFKLIKKLNTNIPYVDFSLALIISVLIIDISTNSYFIFIIHILLNMAAIPLNDNFQIIKRNN